MPSNDDALSATTRRLADFTVNAKTSGLSELARSRGMQTIVDTLASMIAGLNSEPGEIALSYVALPQATTLAELWEHTVVPSEPEAVALVGGTLGAALDYDDVSLVGHPSSILVAAALAASNGRVLDGSTLLDAYLVGYEVGTRIGQMYHLPHSRNGWHTTSTAGYFGAAATVARLWGLSVEQTEHAFGIAASMAAGIGRNFGTTTKPLHSGFAARGGLTAARFAKLGASSGENVLHGPRGFVDIYSLGRGTPETAELLGNPWVFEEQGSSLKKFPACYAGHRLIDAVLHLREEHAVTSDQVEKIIVRAPTRSTSGLMYKHPVTGLQGKFSAEYAAAAALIDGEVTIGSFVDAQVNRNDVQQLMQRIDVQEDPRCRPEDPEAINSNPISGGFWEATIHTVQGEQYVATSSVAPGAPGRDLTWAETVDKFIDCAISVGHDGEQARKVATHLQNLAEVADVREVLQQLGKR